MLHDYSLYTFLARFVKYLNDRAAIFLCGSCRNTNNTGNLYQDNLKKSGRLSAPVILLLIFCFRLVRFLGVDFLLQLFPADGKHQLDAVLLVDLRRAGVIVDRDDVGVGLDLLDAADSALAVDVVGQAAERLRADDVLVARLGKLEHLRCQR